MAYFRVSSIASPGSQFSTARCCRIHCHGGSCWWWKQPNFDPGNAAGDAIDSYRLEVSARPFTPTKSMLVLTFYTFGHAEMLSFHKKNRSFFVDKTWCTQRWVAIPKKKMERNLGNVYKSKPNLKTWLSTLALPSPRSRFSPEVASKSRTEAIYEAPRWLRLLVSFIPILIVCVYTDMWHIQ